MPYRTDQENDDYHPSDPVPNHLDHKPVFAVPYEKFDGHFADDEKNPTDIRYISVGNAQYDGDQVSVKTMRRTEGRWSRQAEELPLHRLIDMTTFLAMVLFQAKDGELEIPAGTFHNQDDTLHVQQEGRRLGELATYEAYLQQHLPLHKERLAALYDVLTELKADGKI
ncbi:MAG: hypothetical protein EOO38_20870 [Cytophagaceae bacterium]|nr:MAG: hypothetical protein EOO38_20870 [Cytophagaceae bacterium]